MIALATDIPLLRRFVAELEATAPRPVTARVDRARHAAEAIDAARLAWAGRIYDEYRSVAIFSELLRLLTDLEAPFAALCAVQRLIGDELRHTELTARVVEWLGGMDDLEIDLADAGLPPRPASESPAERALRIIARELVVAEEESVWALAAYRAAARDPAIRQVLELVLADEVRHAASGRALLALFDEGPLAEHTSELRRELPSIMAADRAALRADYLASARGGPGRELGACLEPDDLVVMWRRASREPAGP
jgi:hypothetical protein